MDIYLVGMLGALIWYHWKRVQPTPMTALGVLLWPVLLVLLVYFVVTDILE